MSKVKTGRIFLPCGDSIFLSNTDDTASAAGTIKVMPYSVSDKGISYKEWKKKIDKKKNTKDA